MFRALRTSSSIQLNHSTKLKGSISKQREICFEKKIFPHESKNSLLKNKLNDDSIYHFDKQNTFTRYPHLLSNFSILNKAKENSQKNVKLCKLKNGTEHEINSIVATMCVLENLLKDDINSFRELILKLHDEQHQLDSDIEEKLTKMGLIGVKALKGTKDIILSAVPASVYDAKSLPDSEMVLNPFCDILTDPFTYAGMKMSRHC